MPFKQARSLSNKLFLGAGLKHSGACLVHPRTALARSAAVCKAHTFSSVLVILMPSSADESGLASAIGVGAGAPTGSAGMTAVGWAVARRAAATRMVPTRATVEMWRHAIGEVAAEEGTRGGEDR